MAPHPRTAPRTLATEADDTIFVSIAAYRDPELRVTIEDCLAKARWPERLRIGICWQRDSEEPPLERLGDPRFRIIEVDWRESRGACWARAAVMSLWSHERWFLQLDSHHRFVQDWDARLLEQARATGSPKPILTTYAGPFTPGDPDSFTAEPMRMEFDRFTHDGLVLFRPGVIPQWRESTAPVRSRFVSAHFLFAPGSFVHEVPYDPDLYFIGEEITLAVRAFTHGYDLFHPGEVILWHEYTREYRTKHWDDHVADSGVELDWTARDTPSRARARLLLTEPHTEAFGCGTERSVADYEAYAGISFPRQRVQDYTRHHHAPPNPPIDNGWIFETRDHTVRIAIPASELASSVWGHAQFWYVGIHDGDGAELFRADAGRDEIDALLAGAERPVTLVRQFESTARPAAWEVRPYSASRGWLDSIGGPLFGDGDGPWENASSARVAVERQPDDSTVLQEPVDLRSWYPQVAPGFGWSESAGRFAFEWADHPERLVTNSTGVLVLELANGRYSIDEIVEAVARAFGLADPPRAQVTEFLRDVSRCGLLELRRFEERKTA